MVKNKNTNTVFPLKYVLTRLKIYNNIIVYINWRALYFAAKIPTKGYNPMTKTDRENKFQIKRAGKEHLDILIDFNMKLALETENRPLNLETLTKSMKAIFEDERKGVYLILFEGDEPLGQIAYVYEWSTWRNANYMWLTDLYIKPEHRKRGLFKVIYQYVMRLYEENPSVLGLRFYVDKTNTSVVPIYKKVGWKESNYDLWEIKKSGCI